MIMNLVRSFLKVEKKVYFLNVIDIKLKNDKTY